MTSVPFGGPVHGDTVHDTSQFWGGWQITIGGATGVGQTFTAPPDNILDRFTFYLGGANPASPTTFEAFVMAWSADRPVGSVLFQSDPQLATSDPAIPFTFLYRWFQRVTETEYVLFLMVEDAGISEERVYSRGR